MRPFAYCRYSSDAQREASIRDQLRNIEEFCIRMNWPMPILFKDEAITGFRNDRPGYRAMLEAAASKAFDVLLIDDISRLSRDQAESILVIRKLTYMGIRIISVSDGIDTDREGYKLEVGLRGLMGELYLDELAKKTHRGLKGQALGGYSAGGLPYGYTSSHDGAGFKRSILESEAIWIRYIFERYAVGVSSRQIASELNELRVPSSRGGTWAHSALYPDAKGVGILGNPIYNGVQIWNRTEWLKDPVSNRRRRSMRPKSEWVITELPELKIIDDELWKACQARAKVAKRDTASKKSIGKNSGGRGPKFLFSGLLKCGVCGGAYVIQGRKHYGCATHQNRGDSVCANRLKVMRETIENTLLAGVKESLLTEQAFRHFENETRYLLAKAKPDTSQAKRMINEAQRDVENLLKAIKAGIITPSTKAALEDAEMRLEAANEDMRELSAFNTSDVLRNAREVYSDLVRRLETIDDVAAAREALRGLIGDVRLVPEDGTLTAEIQSAGLAGALQISLVAGAGLEPATFGL